MHCRGWPCRATDDTVQLSGAVKSWPGLAGRTIILASVFPSSRYVDGIKVLAEQFNQSVLAMVRKAAERVSPAETLGNRRRRRDARRRLAQRYQEAPAAVSSVASAS